MLREVDKMTLPIFHTFLKSVASLVLQANWNDRFSDTIDDFVELLEMAKKSLRIVSGDLEHRLFDDERVLGLMDTVINRDKFPVKVEILCGPDPDPETVKVWKLAEKSKGKLEIIKLRKRPTAHFALVDDGYRIRIEEFHARYQPERKAFMKKRAIFLGSLLRDEFDSMKDSALSPQELTS